MKKTLFSLLLVFALIVACVFALASCKKHKHDYQAEVVPATCTEAGATVYTCECGDTYSEAGEAALGHVMSKKKGIEPTCVKDGCEDYQECTRCGYTDKIVIPATGHSFYVDSIEYPTPGSNGTKELVCSTCRKSVSEEIVATSFIIPSATDLIATLIGELAVTVHLDDDTVFITSAEYSDNSYGKDYADFYAIQVGDAELSNKDGVLQGYVLFELGTAHYEYANGYNSSTPTDFTTFIELSLYLEGDALSYEITLGEEVQEDEVDINEVWFNTIGQMTGLTYNDLMGISYAYSEFTELIPQLESLLTALTEIELPKINEDFGESFVELFGLFGDSILTVSDGENGNKIYRTNIQSVNVLLDEIEGKTLTDLLDTMFGEGSAESLGEFMVSLPEREVKDIINAAIEFAEAAEVDVNSVYEFIDLVVALAAKDADFNIQKLIDDYSDVCLAEILAGSMAEDPEFDKKEFIDELKGQIEETIGMIFENDVDSLYNIITFGDANYIPEGEEEAFSITANIRELTKSLDSVYYLEYTLDSEGNPVSANFIFEDNSIKLTFVNGGFEFTGFDGENEVMNGFISSVVEGNTQTIEASLSAEGKEYFSYSQTIADQVTTEVIVAINAEITEYEGEYVYDPEYGYEVWDPYYYSETTFENVITFKYSNKNGEKSITAEISNHEVIISGIIGEEDGLNVIDFTVDTPENDATGKLVYGFGFTENEELNVHLEFEMSIENTAEVKFAYIIENSVPKKMMMESGVYRTDPETGLLVLQTMMKYELVADDEGNLYISIASEGFEADIFFEKNNDGYTLSAKVVDPAEDKVMAEATAEFKNTDEGFYIGLDVPRFWTVDEEFDEYYPNENGDYEHLDYVLSHYIEIHGGILISAK